jgi:adenylyltransferase/sulfurtransferase
VELTDDLLLRYSRHILLPEIGVTGQTRICDASVLVVGAGGLGARWPCIWGRRASGGLCWRMATRSISAICNVRSATATAAIGENKADPCTQRGAINPEIDVQADRSGAGDRALHEAVATVDLVVDASDNFATRHAVNRACVALGKPLVSGAAIGFSGQLAVFDSRRANALLSLPVSDHADEPSCAAPRPACFHRWSASSRRCRRWKR